MNGLPVCADFEVGAYSPVIATPALVRAPESIVR
jgi:hypothetical protein